MTLSIPGDDNEVCGKCGLWKTCRKPFMDANGPSNAKLLIIGEAPGKDEDSQGIPFVGAAGQILRPLINDIWGDDVAYTNVVRCRPPDNKVTVKAINYCSRFALQDIERINPEVVLLAGNSPLNGILGESGITAWNGVTIEKDGRKFVPIYHPAYILRNQTLLDEWYNTIETALSTSLTNHGTFERIIPHTLGEVEAMEAQLIDRQYIAFDTEVHKLDAYALDNKLLSVSFAIDGFSWALPIDHRDSWWGDSVPKHKIKGEPWISERDKVVGIVLSILTRHTGYVIGHNLKFDQMQIKALMGCEFNAGGDTMLLSHLLDSKQGIHGLKRLAGIHLGMYDYERELYDYRRLHKDADPARGGSYDNVPLDILMPYGAMDAEATWQLHPLFYDKLSEKQRILYDQMLLSVSDTLCEMQCNGMTVDSWLAWRRQMVYEIYQQELYDEVHANRLVKRMLKDRAAEYAREGKKLPADRAWFNPGSFEQKAKLFFEYMKIPIGGLPKTDSGAISTRAADLKPLEGKYPFLTTVRLYNMMTKMLGTYLKPAATGAWLSSIDGKARPTFNMHGTISGRLSSSKPFNSQNIPTPEKEPGTILAYLPIKDIFTHSYYVPNLNLSFEDRYGAGVVMSADFSGMELRCFASIAKCEGMLAIHKSGRDFHSMVAVMSTQRKAVADITDKDIATILKPVRYRYKWTNWTLLYGGNEYTLNRLYGIPLDEARETVETYFSTFPEVPEYQQACVEFAEEHGYIESPFGRRALLPWITDRDEKQRNKARREAVNIPIQSTASDTLLCALAIFRWRLADSGLEAKLVNTVHDSITLDVKRHHVKPVAALVKDTMENVAVLAHDYMPDIDFSWLRCPLKCDIEVGTHYGSLIDLEDWLERQDC